MKRVFRVVAACVSMFVISACDGTPPVADNTNTPAPATAPNVDAELEQLKAVTPADACAWLPAEKLAAIYPDVKFELNQKVDPRLSGYAWDSRCVYWGGVGTIDYAKDLPTHTVEIFAMTPVSVTKAQSNLASRQEMAIGTTGYQTQPDLGTNAYTTLETGVARLFFVKGQSEVQINISDLDTPSDEKIKKTVVIAQSL